MPSVMLVSVMPGLAAAAPSPLSPPPSVSPPRAQPLTARARTDAMATAPMTPRLRLLMFMINLASLCRTVREFSGCSGAGAGRGRQAREWSAGSVPCGRRRPAAEPPPRRRVSRRMVRGSETSPPGSRNSTASRMTPWITRVRLASMVLVNCGDEHVVGAADEGAHDARGAADHHGGDEADRVGEAHRLGRGVLHRDHVEEAAGPAEQRRDREGHHLVAVGRDAHRGGDGLVVADDRHRAAELAPHEVAGEQERDDGDRQHDVVLPLVVVEAAPVGCAREPCRRALRAAGELVEPLGEGEPDDGQRDRHHRDREARRGARPPGRRSAPRAPGSGRRARRRSRCSSRRSPRRR